MGPSFGFDQIGYSHPQRIWKRSGKWFLCYWLLQLEINLFSFVFIYIYILFFFFFAVTLLDSRSVQGELGWIASPLEGGVSSEAFSEARRKKKRVISHFLRV